MQHIIVSSLLCRWPPPPQHAFSYSVIAVLLVWYDNLVDIKKRGVELEVSVKQTLIWWNPDLLGGSEFNVH
jgi:hypothetical protein